MPAGIAVMWRPHKACVVDDQRKAVLVQAEDDLPLMFLLSGILIISFSFCTSMLRMSMRANVCKRCAVVKANKTASFLARNPMLTSSDSGVRSMKLNTVHGSQVEAYLGLGGFFLKNPLNILLRSSLFFRVGLMRANAARVVLRVAKQVPLLKKTVRKCITSFTDEEKIFMLLCVVNCHHRFSALSYWLNVEEVIDDIRISTASGFSPFLKNTSLTRHLPPV